MFRDLTFSIPADKVTAIVAICNQLLGQRNIRVEELAKVVGKLQAVRLTTGPIVANMTRSLNATVDQADSWGSRVKLDPLNRGGTGVVGGEAPHCGQVPHLQLALHHSV